MSSTTIYRLSGIALLIGGVLAAAGNVGQAVFDNPLGPFWILVSVAIDIGLLLVLIGLPAIYALQIERAGRLGLIGFVLFFVACLRFSGASGLTDIVLLPWVMQSVPGGLDNPPVTFTVYFLIGKLAILVGSIVFAIATLRAGVLPKGSAILLLIGGVLFILGGRVRAIPRLDYFGEVLFFLSFAWFGWALRSLRRPAMEQQPSLTPTEVRA